MRKFDHEIIELTNGLRVVVVYWKFVVARSESPYYACASVYLPAVSNQSAGRDSFYLATKLNAKLILPTEFVGEALTAGWGWQLDSPPPLCLPFGLWRTRYTQCCCETAAEARDMVKVHVAKEIAKLRAAIDSAIEPGLSALTDVIKRVFQSGDGDEASARAWARGVIQQLREQGFQVAKIELGDDNDENAE